MNSWIQNIVHWIEQSQAGGYLLIASIVFMLVFSMGVILFFIRAPYDYFFEINDPNAQKARGLGAWTKYVLKNILGGIFVLIGVITLPIPGQSIPALLLGFLLIDFRYKHRIIHWIMQKTKILPKINQWRVNAGRKPLEAHKISETLEPKPPASP